MVSSDFSDVLAKTANRKQNEREHELAGVSSIDSKTQMMTCFFCKEASVEEELQKKSYLAVPSNRDQKPWMYC